MKVFITICVVWMLFRSLVTFAGLGLNAYPFTREHTAGIAVVKLMIALVFVIWGSYLVLT